jgi:hypothetical protein
MGVLYCDRNGCTNIMCDHYSHEYGYICNECLSELKEKPFCDIEDFMNSPKNIGYETDISYWEGKLAEIFTSRWEG